MQRSAAVQHGDRRTQRHSAEAANHRCKSRARAPRRAGRLQLDRADVAAEQFTWLVLAAPLNRLTVQAGHAAITEAELETIATEAAATFLSRYGQHPSTAT